MFGLGLDVPYVKFGTAHGTGTPTTALYCGDPFALQQMLTDLGFYSGMIDGNVGSESLAAVSKFADATGALYTKGTLPQGATCTALMAAWSALHAPAAPATPAVRAPLHVTAAMLPGLMLNVGGKTFTVPSGADDKIKGAASPAAVAAPTSWGLYAAIGGGVLLVGAVAYALTRKKTATANRRNG